MSPRILRHDRETPIPLWLTRVRAKLGWRQRDLAQAVGVTPRTVERWEQGTRVPGSRTRAALNQLARSVDVAPLAPRPRRPVHDMPADWRARDGGTDDREDGRDGAAARDCE